MTASGGAARLPRPRMRWAPTTRGSDGEQARGALRFAAEALGGRADSQPAIDHGLAAAGALERVQVRYEGL